jgi:hypothetical protein
MGLPTGSRAELLEGLFVEGMSTASAVTEISGRGIGMGALRATVLALGGRLVIESELGRGTLVRMSFAALRPSRLASPELPASDVRSGRTGAEASGSPADSER